MYPCAVIINPCYSEEMYSDCSLKLERTIICPRVDLVSSVSGGFATFAESRQAAYNKSGAGSDSA